MSLLVKSKKFYKRYFTLMLSIAMQNMVATAVLLADNIMLGNFSEHALSGAALANQIQFILNMIIMGVGECVVVLSSQYWGKKNIIAIKSIITFAIKLSFLISTAAMAIVFFFPRTILQVFTSDNFIISLGAEYLSYVCFSYVFYAISSTVLAGLRSVETVKIGFYISISTLIINVILNYLLIFGNLSFPQLGVRGAAIATLTSRIAELLIVAVYVYIFDKKIVYRISDLTTKSLQIFKDFIKICIPVLIANASWALAMNIQMVILGHLGNSVIAANSIASTVFQLLSVFAFGASNAAGIIVGKTVGAKKFSELRQYVTTMQVMFITLGVFSGLALFIIKQPIMSFYTLSSETEYLTSNFINILSITVIGTSYHVACLVGIVRGAGDTKFVLYNDLIFQFLIIIPLSFIAAYYWQLSPTIVFFILKSDQILKCFIAFIKVNKTTFAIELTR